jgi:hemoglobin
MLAAVAGTGLRRRDEGEAMAGAGQGVSDYERLGGAAALGALMADFVATMVADPMIGFFFDGVDHARLLQRETELTAAMLGADVAYSGRPLREAHAPHPILGGQFMRRRELLRLAMARHGVPEDVAARLLAHTDRLRPLITREAGSACAGVGQSALPLIVEVIPGLRERVVDAGGGGGDISGPTDP